MNFLKTILTILGLWLSPVLSPPITFPTTTTTSTSTSVVVTTSTTLAVPPSTVPVPVTASAVVPADDIWWSLALCEDGGKNRVYGDYHGYFHFLVSTWQNIGGSGEPQEHGYETQKSFAIKLQRLAGWGQWPGCARKLGLL